MEINLVCKFKTSTRLLEKKRCMRSFCNCKSFQLEDFSTFKCSKTVVKGYRFNFFFLFVEMVWFNMFIFFSPKVNESMFTVITFIFGFLVKSRN